MEQKEERTVEDLRPILERPEWYTPKGVGSFCRRMEQKKGLENLTEESNFSVGGANLKTVKDPAKDPAIGGENGPAVGMQYGNQGMSGLSEGYAKIAPPCPSGEIFVPSSGCVNPCPQGWQKAKHNDWCERQCDPNTEPELCIHPMKLRRRFSLDIPTPSFGGTVSNSLQKWHDAMVKMAKMTLDDDIFDKICDCAVAIGGVFEFDLMSELLPNIEEDDDDSILDVFGSLFEKIGEAIFTCWEVVEELADRVAHELGNVLPFYEYLLRYEEYFTLSNDYGLSIDNIFKRRRRRMAKRRLIEANIPGVGLDSDGNLEVSFSLDAIDQMGEATARRMRGFDQMEEGRRREMVEEYQSFYRKMLSKDDENFLSSNSNARRRNSPNLIEEEGCHEDWSCAKGHASGWTFEFWAAAVYHISYQFSLVNYGLNEDLKEYHVRTKCEGWETELAGAGFDIGYNFWGDMYNVLGQSEEITVGGDLIFIEAGANVEVTKIGDNVIAVGFSGGIGLGFIPLSISVTECDTFKMNSKKGGFEGRSLALDGFGRLGEGHGSANRGPQSG